MLNGLSIINIELTSKCNKSCYMCGRRKIEKQYPNLCNWGDMEFNLIKKISKQLPYSIMVQFHFNGDPLLYPKLYEALSLFKKQIRCLDTNGKLLLEKAGEIINNLDTLTISTFEKDTEWEDQYNILKKFLEIKKEQKPQIIIRCLGNIEPERMQLYNSTNCLIANRILHSPMGSFEYQKKTAVPEHGICLEILSHPAIDRFGNVKICVRFDPHNLGILDNLCNKNLDQIWNGSKRKEWLKYHIEGKRNLIPLCRKCEFWGIPMGK